MSNAAETTVLTYNAGWATNGVTWSRNAPFRLAVSSFVNAYSNAIHIVQRDSNNNQIYRLGALDHYYPPTKILFTPREPTAGVDDGRTTDTLVTSGDYLRMWSLIDGPPPSAENNHAGSHPDQASSEEDKAGERNPGADPAAAPTVSPQSQDITVSRSVVHTFKHAPRPGVSEDFCAPVTSFDWSAEDPRLVAACSIDTTVSLWDLETQLVTVHLIAHDKEVFDVAFQSKGSNVFATCGADGSVRVFDIRRMDHCTVVYENPHLTLPMMRVEWNRQDPNYLAAITAESSDVVVFDFRYPAMSEARLRGGHTGPLNSFAWAPHSSSNLCTAGEDNRAVIWDTQDASRTDGSSGLTYEAGGPLNYVSWSAQHTDWIAVSFAECVQMLHV